MPRELNCTDLMPNQFEFRTRRPWKFANSSSPGRHIPRYNKKTKQLLSVYESSLYYLLDRKQTKSDYFQKSGYLFEIVPSHSPLSGSAIDGHPTFRRFLQRGSSGTSSHLAFEQDSLIVGQLIAGHLVVSRWLYVSIFKLSDTLNAYF